MAEQEGVIKYCLNFKPEGAECSSHDLFLLNECRSILKSRHLIGQDPERYDSYSYGNISIRCSERHGFVISGTQTGKQNVLSGDHIAYVSEIDAPANTLSAIGNIEPSSEAMTHGVLYQVSDEINAVIHVHSPDIWRNCDALGLPATERDIPYGTPQMANAVTGISLSLLKSNCLPIIFAMKGHEDGIVSVGQTLGDCTDLILHYLHRSQDLES